MKLTEVFNQNAIKFNWLVASGINFKRGSPKQSPPSCFCLSETQIIMNEVHLKPDTVTIWTHQCDGPTN